jgi:hypothetical protein
MKQDRRGSWYILTGLVLGVAMGLFYSWVISPVKYVDAPPYALRADFKDEYRALVAAAHLYSYDLLRAEDRLEQLKEDNPSENLAMQAQKALAEGRPDEEVRALGILGLALGEGVTPLALSSSTAQVVISTQSITAITPTPIVNLPISNPTQTSTVPVPQATKTLQPTSTATSAPTVGAAFVLQETMLVCNPDQSQPLMQVEIKDAAGQPVASIELVVTWDGGEDHFFTGLKPELGQGYADFLMTPGVVYSLQIADGGQAVNDLTAAECLLDNGSRYWGSWMLTFIQP